MLQKDGEASTPQLQTSGSRQAFLAAARLFAPHARSLHGGPAAALWRLILLISSRSITGVRGVRRSRDHSGARGHSCTDTQHHKGQDLALKDGTFSWNTPEY